MTIFEALKIPVPGTSKSERFLGFFPVQGFPVPGIVKIPVPEKKAKNRSDLEVPGTENLWYRESQKWPKFCEISVFFQNHEGNEHWAKKVTFY